jgi:transcriptional regulator with XRE-family HTH domain
LNDRIKRVRKDAKKNQNDFGLSLGVMRATYASYESGRVVPTKTFIQLLCSQYNVNEEWLTTGQGEMYVKSEEAAIAALVSELNLDDMDKNILMAYKKLEPEYRKGVWAFIENLAYEVLRGNAMRAQEDVLNEVEHFGGDKKELHDRIHAIFANEFDVAPHEDTETETPSLAFIDKAIEQTNRQFVEVYKAADSETGKEHGVVSEPQEDIDKMYKGKRVIKDEDM